MTDTIHNTILPMTDTTAEPEDYTGEDGAFILRQNAGNPKKLFPGGQDLFRA